MRSVSVVRLIATLLLVPVLRAQDPASAVPELAQKLCGECHVEDTDGDFDLVFLFDPGVIKNGEYTEQLHLAVQRLRSRTMPPPDELQPADAERRELTAALAQLMPSQPGERVATVRRLTRRQYELTVQDLFGVQWRAHDLLPEDAFAHGFVGQGDVQNMSPLLLEKYHDAASEVAKLVLADDKARRVLFAEDRALAETLPQFLAAAFRRPVQNEEVTERLADVAAMQNQGLPAAQVEHALLRGILVSPSFLLRPEFGQEDAPAQLSAHELAVRLSYMLASTTPDASLTASANDNSLLRHDVLIEHAQRLVQLKEGRAFAGDFASQWLGLKQVLTATADFRRYPQIWKHSLRPSFLQEAVRFFAAIVSEDRSVLELIDADYTFVNPVLASHYGLAKVKSGFHRVTLEGKRRGGILGMGAMLMTSSYPLRTSPVKRGQWILTKLLDSPPPPPPPGAGELPKDDKPKDNLTLRQQLEEHRKRRSCAGCHAEMDALGFALENYDVVGRWRDSMHKLPVDAKAELPDGTEIDGPVALKRELRKRGDDIVRAMAKNLLVHGVGRDMGLADEAEIAKIVAATRAKGDRFSALLAAVVTSPLFTMRDIDAADTRPGGGE